MGLKPQSLILKNAYALTKIPEIDVVIADMNIIYTLQQIDLCYYRLPGVDKNNYLITERML